MRRPAIAVLLLFGASTPVWAAGYAYLNVGIGYYNQERYDDAIAWLGKAIDAGDLLPDQLHVAHLDRGNAFLMTDAPEKAAAEFSAALTIRPQDDMSLEARALAYVAMGDHAKASADLATFQTKKPEDIQANFQRGQLYWFLGNYDHAADAFGKTADKGSAYGWMWQQLANIRQGKPVTPFHVASFERVGLHIRTTSGYGWPDTIIGFYSGDRSEEDVLKAAKEAGTPGAECEANFYLAEWRLAHGDKVGAKPMMESAATDCPKEFIEYRDARMEMKSL